MHKNVDILVTEAIIKKQKKEVKRLDICICSMDLK